MVNTYLESKKANHALEITKINSKIQQISENGCPEKKRAIGFTSTPVVEKDEEAFEEDDVDDN